MRIGTTVFLVTLTAVLIVGPSLPAGEPGPFPPDLTQSRNVDRERTYNLGATGLRGWIYTRPANFFESCQGRTTTASRQILVTHVGKESPADGVMQVDDVILGVGGKPFSDDARKSFAVAIQEAEKEANGGILKLTRWRNGKTDEVQLKLRVLGTYSDTAPYDCPKSKRILDEACKVLEKEPLEDSLFGAVNGLALMSTGNPHYLSRVQQLARRMAPKTLKLELKDGMVTWDWGYRNLFLSEYYLLTGDKEVLHAIREYTLSLAKGQSMYGTYGHGIAPPTDEGKLHGSIPPYGPVNATGLVSNLAIVMGKKCGVEDPEVDAAIERASRFFGYYVDKGAIPYGEHEPWPYHDNNGKNAMTAVLFATQGNRTTETQFFAKMVTASYKNREYGHTGQGFSYLWGALGANTGGPAALAAFFKQASWHFDLVRRCDGSFTYDGGEQYGPGKTDDDTYYGASSYYGLSPTASYVLTYSLPLKKLFITGRDANRANWLSKEDVDAAIASGRFDLDRKHETVEDLVAAFDDWSPIVRGWAAEELAKRPEAKAMVPKLIEMAECQDVHVAQSACQVLGDLRSQQALPVLVRQLSHKDRWLRFKAAEAIKKMGGEAKAAIPDILKAVVETAEPLQPIDWEDAVQLTHGQLAAALFEGGLTDYLKEADPKLLYPVIGIMSRNADGMARARLRGFFEHKLTLKDVQTLAPDLLAAVRTRCPADTMFGSEIRMGALKALTRYHYREGIEAAVIFAKTQGGHGSESRTGEIMKEIVGYGSAAREAVPALRELIVDLNAQCERGEFPAGELNDRRTGAVTAAIKAIESATTQPELRSIAAVQPKQTTNTAKRSFIDYFLPMPINGSLSRDAWGATEVGARDQKNGLEDATMTHWDYWDGQIIKGPDGKYHMFASRWDQARGHSGWFGSKAVHAVSDKLTGPYIDKGLCWPNNQGGKGHNVTALVLPDGRYAVVVSETRPGDVFVSRSLDGPWEHLGTIKGNGLHASNISIMVRPDGDYMIVPREGQVFISKAADGILGPYRSAGPSAYPKGIPNLEDPAVFYSGGLYHIVVNSWSTRKAYHLTSKDGKTHWVNRGLAYDPTTDCVRYTDGTVNHWHKMERPGVFIENGRVVAMTFAVLDTPKESQQGSNGHGSKIIVVPFDGAALDRNGR